MTAARPRRPGRSRTGRTRIARAARTVVAFAAVALLAGCTGAPIGTPGDLPKPAASARLEGVSVSTPAQAESLLRSQSQASLREHQLASVIAQIRVDGRVAATVALGSALPGVPATAQDHFRNGAVAITYVAATMLAMAEAGKLDIDQPIARWAPDLPDAGTITPRMLASMTSGYPDFVLSPQFLAASSADPFAQWTDARILAVPGVTTVAYPPGTNWSYSHTGYFALARVLERAGGASLASLVSRYVLKPLGLAQTTASSTPAIPQPVQHAYTGERGVFEDATYWNPSWTLPGGAVETTTIGDMAKSFDALIGRGEGLDPASLRSMIEGLPSGFGGATTACPTCRTVSSAHDYGLGVFLSSGWVMQTPLFAGYSAAVATLPASRNGGHSVTVAVSVTSTQGTYDDWSAALPNWATELVTRLGAALVPSHAPTPFAAPAR